jgi:alkaline phosphatase D
MKSFCFSILIVAFILSSCSKKAENKNIKSKSSPDFVISYGSCNNQNLTNNMWREILKNNPDIFIWGGDIIYSDTYDMKIMKKNYDQQKQDSAYSDFIKKIPVMGTWDDHDYGLNDGGEEYEKKDSVQQIFLDFFDVDSLNHRRKQKGVYYSKQFNVGNNSLNIIVLDTRYFRSNLTKDSTGVKRYIPNKKNEGTILGNEQWRWLENELNTTDSDFNIIISSIQFLSYQHGFETWGNMPLEVKKLKKIISKAKAKGVIIVSGDRHIAEISKDSIINFNYPLIDFTSSGMTHSYSEYSGEENKFRISNVVSQKNFGILKFYFNENKVDFEIRGENNVLFESYSQKY